jgi:hypothetical protein
LIYDLLYNKYQIMAVTGMKVETDIITGIAASQE